MWFVSILTRRLREGTTYEEFRRAWYHAVGFGTTTHLYSALNVADPREVIVVAMGELPAGRDPMELVRTDVEERADHPLDAVIEPEVGRTFGIMVAEDDFSPHGALAYRPPAIQGEPTDLAEVDRALAMARSLIARAMEERDRAHQERSPS